MTLREFADRLLGSARDAGWAAAHQPHYVARTFRGRDDDISPLPEGTGVGLQLGDYPVLASTVRLEDRDALRLSLKRLHGQMVIARSFMRPGEVINAHILLCATESGEGDWSSVMDIAERDESVCRKVVWMPDQNLEDSYAAFVDRTFLARPWEVGEAVRDASLDRNQTVVQRILGECGLSPDLAARWERLARSHGDEPEVLVAKLVELMESGQ